MYIDISIPINSNKEPDIWTEFDEIPTHSVFVSQHIVYGTHVDLPNGRADNLEFDNLMGECLVVRIPDSARNIELGYLLKLPLLPGSRLIFKTKNSANWLRSGHPPTPIGIDIRAAQFLADRRLKLIGVDSWSVDKLSDEDLPIHKLLLDSGCYLLESLYLDHVAPGNYELFALPLMLVERSMSPCRAVLRKIERF